MPGSRPCYALWFAVALVIQGAVPAVSAQPPEEATEPDARSDEAANPGIDEPEDASLTDAELALLAAIRAAGPIEPATERPCPFGTYGPPLNVRDPDVGESGIEIFDPCGLRFTDLSGRWEMSGSFQLIAYHEQRGGALEMRFTHIDPENDYYAVWGYMFGDEWLIGQVSPDRVDLLAIIRYPERMRDTCPDQWEAPFPVHSVHFGFSESGQVRIDGARIRNNLSTRCETSYINTVTDSYVRETAGVRSWMD